MPRAFPAAGGRGPQGRRAAIKPNATQPVLAPSSRFAASHRCRGRMPGTLIQITCGASGCARGVDEGFRRGAGPFIPFRPSLAFATRPSDGRVDRPTYRRADHPRGRAGRRLGQVGLGSDRLVSGGRFDHLGRTPQGSSPCIPTQPFVRPRPTATWPLPGRAASASCPSTGPTDRLPRMCRFC